jgi:hypothetical protein
MCTVLLPPGVNPIAVKINNNKILDGIEENNEKHPG